MKYDLIYLSPHLDDAVLSCGGQIFQQTRQGKRVLLVTIAAGEPEVAVRSVFAQFLHHNWQVSDEEAVRMRREEDAAAVRSLGASFRHWTLPDAIYRVDPRSGEPLYTSDEDIFGVLAPDELSLAGELAERIEQLPQCERLIAPLGVGNHVDHQLTRLAAEAVRGDDLLYYEDYPYVQLYPQAVVELLQPRDQWRSVAVRLSEEALEAKMAAIEAYGSQIGTLFGDLKRMEERVRAHGVERLWYRNQSG